MDKLTIPEIGQKLKQANPGKFDTYSDDQLAQFYLEAKPQARSIVAQEKGLLRKIGESVAKPFAEVGTSALNLTESVFDLARGDMQGSQEALSKTRNVPFLGEVQPAFTGQEEGGEALKKVLGKGLEIGSTVVGGAGAGGVVKAGLGGAIKQGAKAGLVSGAFGGATQGAGSALSEDKSLGEVVGSTIKGGLIGGAGGAVIGTAAPLLGKTVIGTKNIVNKSKKPLKTLGQFVQSKKEEVAESAKGFLEKAPVNIAESKARQARLSVLPEPARKAIRSGVEERDLNVARQANKETLPVIKKMVENAKNFSNNRSAEEPGAIVGQQLRSRLDELEKIRKDVGQKLGDLTKKFNENTGDAMKELGQIDAQRFSLGRMQKVPGLEGIKIKENGTLDFSDTALAGSLTQKDRSVIETVFQDISNKDINQLHRLRQELFEVLGGKKRAKVELNETQEQGLEAIREGISDLLEQRVPGYQKLSSEYREVVTPLKDLRKFLRGVEGADEDILDLRFAQLARRLTSNAQSKGEIAQIIRTIEQILTKKGKSSKIDIELLQDFMNAIERYYDTTLDTSLAGQVKIGTDNFSKEGILRNVFAEGFATPETKRKAFEDFISSL